MDSFLLGRFINVLWTQLFFYFLNPITPFLIIAIELDSIEAQTEGEARVYFEHALTLRDTLRFLRHNAVLVRDAFRNAIFLSSVSLALRAAVSPGGWTWFAANR